MIVAVDLLLALWILTMFGGRSSRTSLGLSVGVPREGCLRRSRSVRLSVLTVIVSGHAEGADTSTFQVCPSGGSIPPLGSNLYLSMVEVADSWHNPSMPMPRKPRSTCPSCGKEASRPSGTYCSNRCQQDYQKKKYVERVERIGAFDATLDNTTPKTYLLRTRGHRCEICKRTTWMGRPIPLVFDHINGNSDDWRLSNVRLVCGNCNMQLPTFTSKNRGNGRYWRRVRYAQGKSS